MGKKELTQSRVDVASQHGVGKQIIEKYTVDDNLLPSPQELSAYQQIDERIIPFLMETASKEQSFRHELEKDKLAAVKKNDSRTFLTNWWGMFFAFLIMILGMAISGFLMYHEKYVIGSIFGGTTILIAIGTFINKSSSNKDSKK